MGFVADGSWRARPSLARTATNQGRLALQLTLILTQQGHPAEPVRAAALAHDLENERHQSTKGDKGPEGQNRSAKAFLPLERSEEHTSELQSPS